ncbi:MAG TPA: hypothetical protein VHD60_00150 [Candidatus Saccharimonadales bacterium]|nr:hypothetical protein [Candidatus Saccharimonadales bacterium]
MVLDIVLLGAAALLCVLAFMYRGIRNPITYNQVYGLGMVCAGLAVGLVVFVITRTFLPRALKHAGGNHKWAHYGYVQVLLALLIAAAIGSWVWVWDRNRYKKC